MTPEAEIVLSGLVFTVFCSIAGLIWRAALQHGKLTHLEAAYVAIHRRLDETKEQLIALDKTLAVLVDRGAPVPPPSPRSRAPNRDDG